MIGEAAGVGEVLADASVGRLADLVRNELGRERSILIRDMAVGLQAGMDPYFALIRFMASPRSPAGKNWPSLDDEFPALQTVAIGSAACASTTMPRARSYAVPSTCQRAMRINS
jgi:hypothetical protein